LKFGVVVFPGSNCDHDAYASIKNVLGENVEFIWHKNKNLNDFDCIILPGGFSYGDYLRTGSIARFANIMDAIYDFANNGGLLIGICNGFQILTEMKLLPGALLMNKNLHFICKHVHLKVENNSIPFTNKLERKKILNIHDLLNKNNRIVFRYCDENGNVTDDSNPNGSLNNIAGITNERGNVLGMMPHPERAMEDIVGSSDGKIIFESIRDFIRNKYNG